MADPIREALCELCKAVQEQFFGADSDLSPRVIKATNEAALLLCRLDAQPTPTATHTALAAEPPAPAPAADGEREATPDHIPGVRNMVPTDGEREELAQWLEGFASDVEADDYTVIYDHNRLRRAAALLRQLPPEGLSVEEYFHIDSGARIISEPSEEWPGRGCWTVRNSRHVNPCTEFRTVADAVAALQQARQQEVGDE